MAMTDASSSEQFALKWNNFSHNLSSGFFSHLNNQDLVDVTIAVDGQLLHAHKLVLSVCSTYFQDIFKVNPCRHPVVILKDIGFAEVDSLLKFMYQGEVNVKQDELASFLKVAEALKVKGLTVDQNNLSDQQKVTNDASRISNGIQKGESDSECSGTIGDHSKPAKPEKNIKKRLQNSSTTHSSTKKSRNSLSILNAVNIPSSAIISPKIEFPNDDNDKGNTLSSNEQITEFTIKQETNINDASIDLTKDDEFIDNEEFFSAVVGSKNIQEPKKRAMTSTERQRLYRARQRSYSELFTNKQKKRPPQTSTERVRRMRERRKNAMIASQSAPSTSLPTELPIVPGNFETHWVCGSVQTESFILPDNA